MSLPLDACVQSGIEISPAAVAAIASSCIALVAVTVSMRSLRHSRRSSLTGLLAKECLELLAKLRLYESTRSGFLASSFADEAAKKARFVELKEKEVQMFGAIRRVQDLHPLGKRVHVQWGAALQQSDDSYFGTGGSLSLPQVRSSSLTAQFEEDCESIREAIRTAMESGFPQP